jgi:DNA gyrase subunit A
MVRMAQPFSMRYLLVDGQGNFGSVDGDAPAAMRYTEVRMSKLAHELLSDIDKETVDFVPNYDESEQEPSVLPALVPNLLVNGSSGIAVGMATNIPTHNLGEVINACVALIDNPEIDIPGLMQHIPGPDFPTAGLISGARGILEAYHTGRGRIILRARTHFEDVGQDKQAIIVTELPYQINKARLLERMAELVREKKIEGITDLRDESDKDGMRMYIELRRGENAEVVLNNLYQQTALQSVFGINMVALDDGQPKLLNLKQLLEAFIRHRREVVTRRTRFDLRKARARAHVLEGLSVALANIDEMIALIKASAGPAEAKTGLMARVWKPGPVTAMLERAGADASRPQDLAPEYGLKPDGYHLSEEQAQAILDLRLHRLTGLEQDKIHAEYQELLATIAQLLEILASDARLMQVIREELLALKEQYGDARRTEILDSHEDLALEDLITPQDVVVTLSHEGYTKWQPLGEYRAQRRGGRGKTAATTREEDFIEKLWVTHTHDTLLCFSSLGKVYWLKVYQLPEASRGSRGKPIVNLLPLEPGERISAVLPIKEYAEGQYVFMATRTGTVKKTALDNFSNQRASGIIALDLRQDDQLVGVALTDGKRDVMLFTDAGKVIRFNEDDVRAMGRTACGVRGIQLPDDASVIGLVIVGDGQILTVSERGYGKRCEMSEYPVHGRGGQGVRALDMTDKTGKVVAAIQVQAGDEIMLISSGGSLVRTGVGEISIMSRNTQGVVLKRVEEGERLVGVDRIVAEENGEE